MLQAKKRIYLSCAIVLVLAIILISALTFGLSPTTAETNSDFSINVTEDGNVTTLHFKNAKSSGLMMAKSLSDEKASTLDILSKYNVSEYGIALADICDSDDFYIQLERFPASTRDVDPGGSTETFFDDFAIMTTADHCADTSGGLPIYEIWGSIFFSIDHLLVAYEDQLVIRHDSNGTYYSGYEREAQIMYHNLDIEIISPSDYSLYGVAYAFSTDFNREVSIVTGTHYVIANGPTAVQTTYLENIVELGLSLTIGPVGTSLGFGDKENNAAPLTINV